MLTASGELKEITSIERESMEEPVPVYNFEVKDWHTYYVSGEEILVHKTYGTPGGANGNKANGKGGSGSRIVNQPKNVERQAKKLRPEARTGYERAIEALESGDTRG